MDSLRTIKTVPIRRWLPYWAVFQSDTRQTVQSWVYRAWVLVSVLAAVGYLLYRVGVYREAGIVQQASTLISDLLRWCIYGSLTLIIVVVGVPSGAPRIVRSGGVSPEALSLKTVALWLLRFVTQSSWFFESTARPVGFLIPVLGPARTRIGAASPLASALKTRI